MLLTERRRRPRYAAPLFHGGSSRCGGDAGAGGGCVRDPDPGEAPDVVTAHAIADHADVGTRTLDNHCPSTDSRLSAVSAGTPGDSLFRYVQARYRDLEARSPRTNVVLALRGTRGNRRGGGVHVRCPHGASGRYWRARRTAASTSSPGAMTIISTAPRSFFRWRTMKLPGSALSKASSGSAWARDGLVKRSTT